MFAQGMVAGAIAGGVYGAFSDRESILGGAVKGAALGGTASRYGPGMRKAMSGRAAPSFGARLGYGARAGIGMAGRDISRGYSGMNKKFATLVSNR